MRYPRQVREEVRRRSRRNRGGPRHRGASPRSRLRRECPSAQARRREPMTIAAIVFSVLSIVLGATSVYFAFEHRRDRKKVAANAINWNYCFCVAEDLRRRISVWDPDLVIGLGRSGGIWGGWMAGNLGSKPFGVVDDKYDDHVVSFPGGDRVLEALRATYPSGCKVLLIEGASTRGTTIKQFKSDFAHLLEGWDLQVAVLFVSTTSDAEIDYIGRYGPEEWPRRLPWHQNRNWITAMRRDGV